MFHPYSLIFLVIFRCSAKLTVRIRHLDKARVWKAKDKKRAKYPTIITIQGRHNHQVINADALKELRVLPKIKDLFFTYFDLGEYNAIEGVELKDMKWSEVREWIWSEVRNWKWSDGWVVTWGKGIDLRKEERRKVTWRQGREVTWAEKEEMKREAAHAPCTSQFSK